jgi:hypothetical protein
MSTEPGGSTDPYKTPMTLLIIYMNKTYYKRRIRMTNFMSREETTNKIRNEGILQIEWCIDDVREQCLSLNDEECKEVLEYLYEKHDANYGINWEVIDYSIRECFLEKWNKYRKEINKDE